MSYNKTTWVNDETPLNAENMNKIESGIENLQVLQGTSAPDSNITAEIGQFYLDTVAKKLYQYVATDEWQAVGGTPKYMHYIHLEKTTSYNAVLNIAVITTDAEAYTTLEQMGAGLTNAGYKDGKVIQATGYQTDALNDFSTIKIVYEAKFTGSSSTFGTTFQNNYIKFINGTASESTRDTPYNSIIDKVVAL